MDLPLLVRNWSVPTTLITSWVCINALAGFCGGFTVLIICVLAKGMATVLILVVGFRFLGWDRCLDFLGALEDILSGLD